MKHPNQKRKRLTVGTRAQANRASVKTLFAPVNGGTATRHMAYNRGKYARDLRGESVDVGEHVVALYTERRKDRDGVYWVLRCVTAEVRTDA